MVKNYYAVTLLFHFMSLTATGQEPIHTKQTQEARAYISPSVETLQKDKDFCIKTLADESSDINALSPSGKTALQLLTLYFINNFTTEQLIAHALKRGANVNVQDEFERTPLFFVTAYTLCPEIFAEKQATLDIELAKNKEAATKTKTNDQDTTTKSTIVEKDTPLPTQKSTRNPLHDRTLSLAVIELLLAFNADPTVTDIDGISPLLLAISTGDEEVVELFSRYGMLEKIFQENGTEEDSAEVSMENTTTEE